MKTFEVKTSLFEGPFDLLLFFIRRDELDINDIPIARVTRDFLDYIQQLEQLNIEVASEFIVVAATLMRIKAKMLLPRQDKDEEGNELDPRQELVKHLLEYKKYKSVISELEAWEEQMLLREKRGNVLEEIRKLAEPQSVEAELQDLNLYKLLKTFQRVIKRFETTQQKPVHTVKPYPYKIDDQKIFLKDLLLNNPARGLSFLEVIALNPSKIWAIFNFMAILEMLAAGELHIKTGEGFNNFQVMLPQARVEAQKSCSD